MNIRRAEESDVPQLETLFLRTRQQTFHWEHPDKFKLEDYRKATVGETIFVAEEGAIVGFLSMISIPSFFRFLAKAKRAEAYMNLGSLYVAQKTHWAEHGTFSSVLNGKDGVGWKPEGYSGGGAHGGCRRTPSP